MGNTVRLEGGREVERTAGGRWREIGSGRFVSKEEVEQDGGEREKQAALLTEVVAAVRRAGYEIGSLEEAWGVILGVQAEIALDKEGGSKTTTAAKFLQEAIESGDEDGEQDEALVLGKELAQMVLKLIEEEVEGPAMDAGESRPGVLDN